MRNIWQVIKSNVRGAVRSLFSPLLHLIARRRAPPSKPPGEMSAHDFEVPLRDAVLRRLEVWAPVLVMLMAGFITLATVRWLSTK